MPEISDDIQESRRTISVKIIYDYEKDDFIIESEFDDAQNTIKCLQWGLKRYLEQVEKYKCPNCDSEVKSEWFACPSCGKDL